MPGAMQPLGEGCPAVNAEGIEGRQPGEPTVTVGRNAEPVMSFIQQEFNYVHYIPVPKTDGHVYI